MCHFLVHQRTFIAEMFFGKKYKGYMLRPTTYGNFVKMSLFSTFPPFNQLPSSRIFLQSIKCFISMREEQTFIVILHTEAVT